VAALRANGIEAGSLNSGNDAAENKRVQDAVRDGTLRLLYASPERLANEPVVDWLRRSGANLLAIDEAHCVSQWGHDFRPEYALLGEVRRALNGVQAIALTATADASTRSDILHRLFPGEPRVFVHGFDRRTCASPSREGEHRPASSRLSRPPPGRERHRLLPVAQVDGAGGRDAARKRLQARCPTTPA
jgi:ATP-dependent DNA helicase RecQ